MKTMVLQTAFFIAQELLKLNAFVLLGIVFFLAFVAYKVFAIVLRILLTGVAFGSFPLIANVVGIPVPLSMESVLWSAITGILMYFTYTGMKFGFGVLSLVFSPFRKTFGKKRQKRAAGTAKD